MKTAPYSLDGYKLFHGGVLCFADIEDTGIRIDVKYFVKQYGKLKDEVENIQVKIKRSSEGKEWKKRFGEKTNLGSNDQLGTMLYKEWGFKPSRRTSSGKGAVDESSLSEIDSDFVRSLLRIRKLEKVKETYIGGLLRCSTDGFLHPSFNLHFVQSFRSSSDDPNFQNIPVRDPEMGDLVRKGFLPLENNHRFGELDYGGIEVCSNACYNRDPNLIAYIKDPTKDMHRDVAGECFMLKKDQIGKVIRYVGKNGFTFPEFYGSYFERVALSMWGMIDDHNLITEDSIPVKRHLQSKGIKNLIQFTSHIKKVEDHFWNVRFKKYKEWKWNWWNEYLKRGYFDLLTGFRCSGPMERNEVGNYPGQGTAFHFLLWSLIQLHRWLTVNEMETKILGQVHDSVVFSFHKDEVEIVLKKAKKIMCEDIKKHWPWICVPLTIEAKIASLKGTWADMEVIEL